MVQFIQDFQKMADASRHSIKGGNEHDIELAPSGICITDVRI